MTTKSFLPIMAIVAATFTACTPQPVCVDTFSVVAVEAFEQPLFTNSDGQTFETYEEAEEYAAFIAYTDSTAYVQTTTTCN